MGLIREATICDHVIPHRGDRDLFWNGETQSLCAPCHDAIKQSEERGSDAYSSITDAQGFPLDPRHPQNVYARERQRREATRSGEPSEADEDRP